MTSYQVRADIFPANLLLTKSDGEEKTFDKVRIVITLDHVYVFQDDHPKPSIVFEDRLTSYTPPVRATRVRKATELLDRTAQFETEDGYSAKFLRTGGCGCGSRLKTAKLDSLLPDNTMTSAASTGDSA